MAFKRFFFLCIFYGATFYFSFHVNLRLVDGKTIAVVCRDSTYCRNGTICCPSPNDEDKFECCPDARGTLHSFETKIERELEEMDREMTDNAIPKRKICPDKKRECPETFSCCPQSNENFGCCPFKDGTCCPDKIHCCLTITDCSTLTTMSDNSSELFSCVSLKEARNFEKENEDTANKNFMKVLFLSSLFLVLLVSIGFMFCLTPKPNLQRNFH